MSPSVKSPTRLRRVAAALAPTLFAGLMFAALSSASQVAAAQSGEIDINAAAAAAPKVPAPPSYILRCWQYGRLIFEELDLPVQAGLEAATPKMKLLDAAGLPLFVSETKNATCILRPRPDSEHVPAP
ncbi:MAG TPA: hypothetical protein VH183_10065 [Burkholderiaceae bacterium]|jgi:hypothetical protein|nr:hypothetical protein [Burkholderiaceae bacterium]